MLVEPLEVLISKIGAEVSVAAVEVSLTVEFFGLACQGFCLTHHGGISSTMNRRVRPAATAFVAKVETETMVAGPLLLLVRVVGITVSIQRLLELVVGSRVTMEIPRSSENLLYVLHDLLSK